MADEDGTPHVVPIGRAKVPSGVVNRLLSLGTGAVAFWACLTGHDGLFAVFMTLSLLINAVDLMMGLATQRRGEALAKNRPSQPPAEPPPTGGPDPTRGA